MHPSFMYCSVLNCSLTILFTFMHGLLLKYIFSKFSHQLTALILCKILHNSSLFYHILSLSQQNMEYFVFFINIFLSELLQSKTFPVWHKAAYTSQILVAIIFYTIILFWTEFSQTSSQLVPLIFFSPNKYIPFI